MGVARYVAIIAVTALLALPAQAAAEPRGKTTLNETITVTNTPGSFFQPRTGPGEGYVVRGGGGLGHGRERRAARRRALLTFGQITDPQVADSQSPARAEWAQPAGPLLTWDLAAAGGARGRAPSTQLHPQPERQPGLAGPRRPRPAPARAVRRLHRRLARQSAAQRVDLVPRGAAPADASTRSPASRSPRADPCTPLNGEPVTPELIARAQRRRRGAPLLRRPGLRRLPDRAGGPQGRVLGSGRAASEGPLPGLPELSGPLWNARCSRTPHRGCGSPGTSCAGTTTG